MTDFAILVGKTLTPEETFILRYCDPSKFKVHPKDKSEVTAALVIRELEQVATGALKLALINRDT